MQSLLLTKGKIVIRDPKSFERHRELLQSELKKDMADAISYMSNFLGLDMTVLGLNSIVNRHETVFPISLTGVATVFLRLLTLGK